MPQEKCVQPMDMKQTYKEKRKVTLICQISYGRTEITAEDVLYIPDLKANLLTMPTLSEKGFAIHLENNVGTVSLQGEQYSTGALKTGDFE